MAGHALEPLTRWSSPRTRQTFATLDSSRMQLPVACLGDRLPPSGTAATVGGGSFPCNGTTSSATAGSDSNTVDSSRAA